MNPPRALGLAIGVGVSCLVLAAKVQACPLETLSSPQSHDAPAFLDSLLRMQDSCLHSAPYYRLLGQAWMEAGSPPQALEAYERALLLSPDHPATQLDYAYALVLVGDDASARELLQALLKRADLPEHLRPLLQAQWQQLEAPRTGWLHQWTLAAALVADDNLNQAPGAGSLTLTLPQGNVELPVDDDFLPRQGLALQTQLQWTGFYPVGDTLWVAQADWTHRQQAEGAYRYHQANAELTWMQAPKAHSQWVLKGGVTQLDWAGSHVYNGWQSSIQRQWRLNADCRFWAGPEGEFRRYPQSSQSNGTYLGLAAAWHCASPSGVWQVQLHWGRDTPDQSQRPGGQFAQQELRLAWQQEQAGWRAGVEYQWLAQQDASGYSPLLANNARRRQSRHALVLEASVPLQAGQSGWSGFVTLQAYRQHSNLQPFQLSRNAVSVGLRHVWN